MLALGLSGQAAGTVLVTTPAYLIPLLHLHRGMPLAEAGLLSSAPTFGTMLTLVAWGALADARGERGVIAGGLGLTAVFAVAAAFVPGYLGLAAMLMLGGAASASTNAASGRVVAGWFPRSRRGLAMGIRQMAQPIGVAVTALVVPSLADHLGVGAPLLLSGALTAILAVGCWFGIVNPPRPVVKPADADTPDGAGTPADAGRPDNPYRGSRFLGRIHLLSALLVFPQFTLSIFGLVWLVTALHWNPAAAGLVIAAAQIVGALGRIAVGMVSDRVGSRVRVLRWVTVSGVVVMLALAASGALGWSVISALVLVLASAVSVADNGLSYTSIAEAAGPSWSGRALGIQNTGQFLVASVVGPGVGALIGVVGYPVAFALVALTPLTAFPLVPTRDRHWA